MTHDLIKVLLMGLETSIKKVVVSELKDDTFYALIWLEREGKLISVDSRPSDALALALAARLSDLRRREGAAVFEESSHCFRKGQQRRTAQMARELERRGSGPLQDVSRSVPNKKPRKHFSSRAFLFVSFTLSSALRSFFGGAVVCTPGIVGSLKVSM